MGADEDLLALGREIRRHRKAKKFSQEQLAERAELTRNYVGYLERGERNPRAKTLFQLARALTYEASAASAGSAEIAKVIEASVLEPCSCLGCVVQVLRSIQGKTSRGFEESIRSVLQAPPNSSGSSALVVVRLWITQARQRCQSPALSVERSRRARPPADARTAQPRVVSPSVWLALRGRPGSGV